METLSEIKNSIQAECCQPSRISENYVKPEMDEVIVSIGNLPDGVIQMAREVGSNGFVFGLSPLERDIKIAFDKAEAEGVTNVDFLKSGLEKIKLGDEIANHVTADCTISKVMDKNAVWQEIYRILKKGGRFTVRDIYKPNSGSRFAGDPGCSASAFTRAGYLEMLYNLGFTMIRFTDEIKQTKNGTELTSFTATGEKPGEKISQACRI